MHLGEVIGGNPKRSRNVLIRGQATGAARQDINRMQRHSSGIRNSQTGKHDSLPSLFSIAVPEYYICPAQGNFPWACKPCVLYFV
jgi:hypothetical protein